VRERCGIFDVSHMGEVEAARPQGGAVCQELTVNRRARLRIGDGQYTFLCTIGRGTGRLIVFHWGRTLSDDGERRRHRYDVAGSVRGQAAGPSDRSQRDARARPQGPDSETVLRS